MTFPLVEIHWIDSYSNNEWMTCDKGNAPNPPTRGAASTPIKTVAFLIHEDDKTVTVTHTLHHHETGELVYFGPLTIPKVAILGRWEIKVK